MVRCPRYSFRELRHESLSNAPLVPLLCCATVVELRSEADLLRQNLASLEAASETAAMDAATVIAALKEKLFAAEDKRLESHAAAARTISGMKQRLALVEAKGDLAETAAAAQVTSLQEALARSAEDHAQRLGASEARCEARAGELAVLLGEARRAGASALATLEAERARNDLELALAAAEGLGLAALASGVAAAAAAEERLLAPEARWTAALVAVAASGVGHKARAAKLEERLRVLSSALFAAQAAAAATTTAAVATIAPDPAPVPAPALGSQPHRWVAGGTGSGSSAETDLLADLRSQLASAQAAAAEAPPAAAEAAAAAAAAAQPLVSGTSPEALETAAALRLRLAETVRREKAQAAAARKAARKAAREAKEHRRAQRGKAEAVWRSSLREILRL